MRRLALDYGDKRIGVAVSDELGWTAQPLEVIRRTNAEADLARIAELVRQHRAGEVIVGLPVNMDGTVGPRGEICKAFADRLRERLDVPVVLWDERLTTAMAERALIAADVSRQKRRQVVDKMAAAILLQHYLETNKGNGGHGDGGG